MTIIVLIRGLLMGGDGLIDNNRLFSLKYVILSSLMMGGVYNEL